MWYHPPPFCRFPICTVEPVVSRILLSLGGEVDLGRAEAAVRGLLAATGIWEALVRVESGYREREV